MSKFEIKYGDNQDLISRSDMGLARKKEAQLVRIVLNEGYMPVAVPGNKVMLTNATRAIFLSQNLMDEGGFRQGMINAGRVAGIDGAELLDSLNKEGFEMQTCNAVQEEYFNKFSKMQSLQREAVIENIQKNTQKFEELARKAGLDMGLILSVRMQTLKDVDKMKEFCIQSELENIR